MRKFGVKSMFMNILRKATEMTLSWAAGLKKGLTDSQNERNTLTRENCVARGDANPPVAFPRGGQFENVVVCSLPSEYQREIRDTHSHEQDVDMVLLTPLRNPNFSLIEGSSEYVDTIPARCCEASVSPATATIPSPPDAHSRSAEWSPGPELWLYGAKERKRNQNDKYKLKDRFPLVRTRWPDGSVNLKKWSRASPYP